jgi:hypothetical protein
MTLLFTRREPLPVSAVARRMRRAEADIQALAVGLAESGHLVYSGDGLIVGVCGLSTVPTRHEWRTGGVTRWTWCAWDAISLAMLTGGTSEVVTASPASGAPITVWCDEDGQAAEPDTAVLLFAERPEDCVTVRDWCPLVNMFEDLQQARTWMEQNGVTGEIQDPGPAAKAGAESFRPLLDLTPSRPPLWRRLLSRQP